MLRVRKGKVLPKWSAETRQERSLAFPIRWWHSPFLLLGRITQPKQSENQTIHLGIQTKRHRSHRSSLRRRDCHFGRAHCVPHHEFQSGIRNTIILRCSGNRTHSLIRHLRCSNCGPTRQLQRFRITFTSKINTKGSNIYIGIRVFCDRIDPAGSILRSAMGIQNPAQHPILRRKCHWNPTGLLIRATKTLS